MNEYDTDRFWDLLRLLKILSDGIAEHRAQVMWRRLDDIWVSRG